MSDFPYNLVIPDGLVTIDPNSMCSLGYASYTGAAVSVAWQSANRAIYIPFRISRSILVLNMYTFNGAVVNGNLDIGIYDKHGTRIVSSGSTAQAGVSSIQTLNITDTVIGPGLFYMALALSTNGTILFQNTGATGMFMKAMGLAQQANAFPLPANATFATYTDYLWHFGLTARSIV